MKYAFLVSIAVFAFLVSCGKKDKKLGESGKTEGATQSDCSGKNTETEKCKEKAAAEAAAKAQADAMAQIISPVNVESGAEIATDSIETIPNVKDKDLKADSKMSITLGNNTALIANAKIDADTSNLIATRILCAGQEDITKKSDIANVVETNPEKLTKKVDFYLLNNSSIVTDIAVGVGDKTTTPKAYMFTCNNNSEVKVSHYIDSNGKSKQESVEVKQIKPGQNAFEVVTVGTASQGILVSFECNNDEDLLANRVTLLGKKAANRIRLRVGSALMIGRAVETKENNKTIKELGSDAQKKVTHSLISCNS